MSKTLIGILAGLGGMLGWGTSDFLANNASEKAGHRKTFFWSQIAGLALIIFLVIAFKAKFSSDLLFLSIAISGGITYALGYLYFYQGFEKGNVSVISAVINIQILIIIAISYFFRGQRLSTLQIPAIALIIIGILIVSVDLNELKRGSVSLLAGVKEALIAALLFGTLYWPLNEYVVEKYDWLAVSLITKLVALGVVYLLSLWRKESLRLTSPSTKFIVLLAAVGLLEALGVLSVTYGQSYGDSILVAPIASSLTVVTVILAMIFTKERINKAQALAIVMVVIGIILSALG